MKAVWYGYIYGQMEIKHKIENKEINTSRYGNYVVNMTFLLSGKKEPFNIRYCDN